MIQDFCSLPCRFDGFYDGVLSDGVVKLRLKTTKPAEPERDRPPKYDFDIIVSDAEGNEAVAGGIDFWAGYTELFFYAGNSGYEINEEFRGKGYAARACVLLKELMRFHGMEKIHIGVEPGNRASERVCEKAGASFLLETDVPESSDLYKDGTPCIRLFVLEA